METLKFNYGETPEPVIRERCGVSPIAFYGNVSVPDLDGTVDDLLTVLRDLRTATNVVYLGDTDTDSARLRISILAALGIDES